MGGGLQVNYYYNDLGDNAAAATQGGTGALAKTVTTPNEAGGTVLTTTTTYQYWDSAKQLTIKKQAANQASPDWAPGLSSLGYDVNGYLQTAIDTTGGRTLRYTSNATGLVLGRTEDRGNTRYDHFWYYAGGRRVGVSAQACHVDFPRLSAPRRPGRSRLGAYHDPHGKHF